MALLPVEVCYMIHNCASPGLYFCTCVSAWRKVNIHDIPLDAGTSKTTGVTGNTGESLELSLAVHVSSMVTACIAYSNLPLQRHLWHQHSEQQ